MDEAALHGNPGGPDDEVSVVGDHYAQFRQGPRDPNAKKAKGGSHSQGRSHHPNRRHLGWWWLLCSPGQAQSTGSWDGPRPCLKGCV